MSNLKNALQQLREEHKEAQQQVEKLQKAISVLEGLVGRNSSGASRNGARPGRIVSAAARRRMAAAQRARRARESGQANPAAEKKATSAAPKRRISAEGRKRIAAATRARWAKFRALKAKKAA